MNVDEHHEIGRIAWPGLSLDREVFAAHVALVSPGEAPPREHAADLFLACACTEGVPGAVEAFERSIGGDIVRAVARVAPNEAFIDDAAQAVRERLFVPAAEGAPRIALYAGRGPLRAWVKQLAARTAMNLRRGKAESRHEELGSSPDLAAPVESPETGIVRAKYRGQLDQALAAATRRLDAADREILRLHFIERKTTEAIAAAYGTSKTSAGRRLVAARGTLRALTRAAFCDLAGVSVAEFTTISGALRGEMESSVAELLARI